ncbi:hypothetical protein JT723_05555 [Streptomyces bryophytorum]|uniref:Uncharacterized protein n=1 Tax=Actinacidiphila bryophytorum TaxID=1436133 RepID=A0A9W4GZ38_9ACTN|nr:hypothetical protein [Actinacidiphila bryophytorum]MBM9435315.1 hypothetical protein [Actinacidiphila bryophytorum]MBN6542197.1 hypothetical protein [Actinacidiphila bryophytorum]CAG7606736.1 hypothetical protein SBRY_10964 [Actinacidiphila bryophytorum]
MSDTTIEQIPGGEAAVEAVPASDEQLVEMLVDRARCEGLQLTGEGGLLQQLTKRVLIRFAGGTPGKRPGAGR